MENEQFSWMFFFCPGVPGMRGGGPTVLHVSALADHGDCGWWWEDARSLTPRCLATCKLVLKLRDDKHIARSSSRLRNNNINTIWRGSVLTSEEPPPQLNHALFRTGGPTQSQLSRPMSSGHHISMEHRLRRKHLHS